MVSPHTVEVAPSILAGNHAALKDSLVVAEQTPGIRWLHLDIMDGHFVPNLTFGPKTVADLRPDSLLYFDVHLMLDNPQDYVAAFVDAGADNITIHAEPDYAVAQTLSAIRERDKHCGIAINPGTPVELIKPYLESVDLVLLMTVQPGFGGQSFQENVLPKIETVANWRDSAALSYRIEVDGGVNGDTGQQCRDAGADTLVAGTAFYKADDRADFVRRLTDGR